MPYFASKILQFVLQQFHGIQLASFWTNGKETHDLCKFLFSRQQTTIKGIIVIGWKLMSFKNSKVEKILKGSLDSIPSPHIHRQWKFKLRAGKFAWGVKAKDCWALSTNFWKQKVCLHHPAMFCLITSSKLSRQ